jgi:hypothetical protein
VNGNERIGDGDVVPNEFDDLLDLLSEDRADDAGPAPPSVVQPVLGAARAAVNVEPHAGAAAACRLAVDQTGKHAS